MISYSLAEKNRDLNQAFEKAERMEGVKDKLTNEIAAMKMNLREKDDEIQRYEMEASDRPVYFFSLVSEKNVNEFDLIVNKIFKIHVYK